MLYRNIFFVIGFTASTGSPPIVSSQVIQISFILVIGIKDAGPNGLNKVLHHSPTGPGRLAVSTKC